MGSISHWGSSNDGHRLVYVANRTQIASDTIGALLVIEGFRTASGRSEAALFEALTSTIPDVVVLDESIGRNLGLGALAGLRRAYPRLPVILLTALFILIAYKKGEKPRWQWGHPKK